MVSDEEVVCFFDAVWKEAEQYYKCKKCNDGECKQGDMRCGEAIDWALNAMKNVGGSKGNKW